MGCRHPDPAKAVATVAALSASVLQREFGVIAELLRDPLGAAPAGARPARSAVPPVAATAADRLLPPDRAPRAPGIVVWVIGV